MNKSIVFSLEIFLCLISQKFFAQNNFQYISATKGAACYEVQYFSGHLYAGNGNTLAVYDVSSGLPPYPKTYEYRFSSNIDDIVINNNKLFVAANHAGLSMWNLSNPAMPQYLDRYLPDSLDEAAYNLAFYGDSIFVAYKTKMALFKDNGNTLTLLNRFAYQTGNTKIRGCEVKDSVLAFTCAYGPDSVTGVHLYNARTLTPFSFYEQVYCDPENVIFGKNNNLLHVLGGTQSLASLGLDPKGLFYSLDISDPSNPIEVYRDTLPGIIFYAVAMPMNGENINDTLYIATQSAVDMNYLNGDSLTGQVYIYDCTNQSNIHRINSEYAGLWHFDLAIHNHDMFVASEWYGVKTIDITDIFNEADKGNTMTGGWNCGSDKFGNKLVVANEGFGFKVFDITDLQNPVMINYRSDTGFCYNVDFSKNGNYIFGYYYTGDDFRVFDATTMAQVGALPISAFQADYRRTTVWHDKAVSIQLVGLNKNLLVIDVTNPLIQVIDTTIAMNNIKDFCIDKNGKLFVSTVDSLTVLDLSNNMGRMVSVYPGGLQDYNAIAEYKDTIYVYLSGLSAGVLKFVYNGTNVLTQISNTPIPILNPKFMAVDSFGLYLNYVEEGLFAFNKTTIAQTGYYRHGMEFIFPNQWGIQDVFSKDNLIFLVEYFGQTTILSNDDSLVLLSVKSKMKDENSPYIIYPNPTTGAFKIQRHQKIEDEMLVEIYNVAGEIVLMRKVFGNEIVIGDSELRAEVYLVKITTSKETYLTKLLKIENKK